MQLDNSLPFFLQTCALPHRVRHTYLLLFLHDSVVFLEAEKILFCSLWQVPRQYCQQKGSIFSFCEVAVWRVDEKPLSLSISRLPNARRSWCGSVRLPYLLGVPDGAGLFYSWPIGCRLPTLSPRSGSAGALSTSGCGGFSRRVSRDWQTNQVAAIGVCRSRLPCGSSTTWAHDTPPQTRWSPVDGDKFRAKLSRVRRCAVAVQRRK